MMEKSLNFISELKELRKNQKISNDVYHKEITDVFRKNLNLKYTEVIGQGSISTVLRVWNEEGGKGLAMKIVLSEDMGPKEKEWEQLNNKNILPLLDTSDFPVFGLTWFISKRVDLTLDDVLKKKVIFDEPINFKLAVSWIKEITSALDYLHTKKLSFLNLKLSNVMICSDKSAKLFGFHRMNGIEKYTAGYEMPEGFLPPECYSAEDRKRPVKEKGFDLWCLSMISIEVLTGNYLSRNIPDKVCCWSDIMYPLLFKVLKKKNFNKECRLFFPNCSIKNNTLKIARNFCRACLRLAPESRPSTTVLLNHKLFENDGSLAEKEWIWEKLFKSKPIREKCRKNNPFPANTNRNIKVNRADVHEINMENDETPKCILPFLEKTESLIQSPSCSKASQVDNYEISMEKDTMLQYPLPCLQKTESSDQSQPISSKISQDDISQINMKNEEITEYPVPLLEESESVDEVPCLQKTKSTDQSQSISSKTSQDDMAEISMKNDEITQYPVPVLEQSESADEVPCLQKTESSDQSQSISFKTSQDDISDINMKNDGITQNVEYEIKCKPEAVKFKNIDSTKALPRMDSIGFKIASKFFYYFI